MRCSAASSGETAICLTPLPQLARPALLEGDSMHLFPATTAHSASDSCRTLGHYLLLGRTWCEMPAA